MQSDENSFCGDVVLNSFNMAYRDTGSILDQKYKNTAHIDKELIYLGLSATVVLVCIIE